MFTGEVDFVVDQEKERREKVYRQQEALQEPGAINKFLEEITDLSSKVALADPEVFKKIKSRVREIVDINVGVVENPDVYLQNKVDNEISRLKDEIFKIEYPKIYTLTKEALMKDLPKGIDIYNGQQVRNWLILFSLEHLPTVMREGLFFGKWKIVAGIKPIRASAIEALRGSEFGEEKIGKFGDFEKLESRLEKFEDEIDGDPQKKEIFKRLVSERHDRVRCRVYANTEFRLSYLLGEIRYRGADVLKELMGKKAEWNYYMSEWLYKKDGEVVVREVEDRGGPDSSVGFFRNVATDLDPEDLVYAAWHTHLKFGRFLGPRIPVEVQVFPFEFAAMHALLERVFKRDKPDLNAVSPVLRKVANGNAKKYYVG